MLHKAGAKHVVEDFADYDRLLRVLNEAETPSEEFLTSDIRDY